MNAKVNCQNVGAKLVKIETEDENQFIKTEYLSRRDLYWIGLSDSVKEGEWKWTDQTGLIGYANWRKDQPNNYDDQDCVAIVNGWYFNAEWNDDFCSKQLGYICEK